jgi:Mg2+ and Co2+ transporter CorA
MSEHDETPVNIEKAVDETKEHTGEVVGRLSDEFREFGRQLLRAMRSVAESPELRNVGQEIVESLRHIGGEVQQAYERTKESDEVKGLGQQAKRVTQTLNENVRSNEMASDVQQGLSKALHNLNEELNKVIDQIQSRSARVSEEVEGTAKDVANQVEDKATEVADILETKVEETKNDNQ